MSNHDRIHQGLRGLRWPASVAAAALIAAGLLLSLMPGQAGAAAGANARVDQAAPTVPAGATLRMAQGERPRVSLDAAVAKVRERYEGQVVRAETRYSRDGVAIHHVRLLTQQGRLRTVRVDGRTGRIL